MGSAEATVDWSGGYVTKLLEEGYTIPHEPMQYDYSPAEGRIRYQGYYNLRSKGLTDLVETVRGIPLSEKGYQFAKQLLQTMRPEKSPAPTRLVKNPEVATRVIGITPAASALAGYGSTYIRNPYSGGYGPPFGSGSFGNFPPPLSASAAHHRSYGMGSNNLTGGGFSLPLGPRPDRSNNDGKPGTNPPRDEGREPGDMGQPNPTEG